MSAAAMVDSWPELIGGSKFIYRPETRDRYILEHVFTRNVYGADSSLAGGIVIDIGAHIGAFSVLATNLGAARVFAYEPEHDNHRLLIRNVELNQAWQVLACHFAVDGEAGTKRLHLSDWCTGCHSLDSRLNNLSEERFQEVRTVTIGSIFEDHCIERCAFLKLDCEGAEEAILPYVLRHLADRIDRIAVEFHRPAFRDAMVSELNQRYHAEQVSLMEWRFVRVVH